MRKLCVFLICLGLVACQRTPSEVAGKVMADFGLKERPEGYVSGSDKVFKQLDEVGMAEMKRLNQEGRHGEVKYQQDGLRGAYYKAVKVYERAYPLDATHVNRASHETQSYIGFIEYQYRIYESPRKSTRAEASAASASIATEETGRESYRYTFNSSGVWNGGKGEKSRR